MSFQGYVIKDYVALALALPQTMLSGEPAATSLIYVGLWKVLHGEEIKVPCQQPAPTCQAPYNCTLMRDPKPELQN